MRLFNFKLDENCSIYKEIDFFFFCFCQTEKKNIDLMCVCMKRYIYIHTMTPCSMHELDTHLQCRRKHQFKTRKGYTYTVKSILECKMIIINSLDAEWIVLSFILYHLL